MAEARVAARSSNILEARKVMGANIEARFDRKAKANRGIKFAKKIKGRSGVFGHFGF